MNEKNDKTHCGFVAIVGRPNVGKSTLLNRLLGKKISITSRKPQTTRYQILGIKTDKQNQIIYVDTPGLHSDLHGEMDRYMNRVARAAWQGVVLIVFVVDAHHFTEEDEWVLNQIKVANLPIMLAINKIDRLADRSALLPYIEDMAEKFQFYKIIPLSAKTGDQVDELEKEIITRLPAEPFQFPPDQITDRHEQFMAAEIIREKLMRQLGQEIPYALTVTIIAFKKEEKITRISAVIWVEKPGQKGIVIGKAGERLKKVGKNARLDLEKLFEQKVFLQLWVKIKSNWSDDNSSLKELGFEE